MNKQNNILEGFKNNECVGCSNCKNICPSKAISMRYQKDGFLYPVIDSNKCISCGMCKKVCQILERNGSCTDKKIESYIAITKDKQMYMNAASGGIFGTLAKYFLTHFQDSSVVGATYVDGKVQHIFVNSANDIHILQNSKYVQSYLNSVFVSIRERLDNNQYVLFSGTPCQVYALKLFLRKDYEKLFTIDLICHGVPSPLFLEKDLKAYGSDVKEFSFRNKKFFFKSRSMFILSISRSKNKHGGKKVMYNRDPFYSLFTSNLSFRESCYDCKFASINRVGDITIGDCDSYKLYPDFHLKEATSTVLVNSDKGKILWKEMSEYFEYRELDLNKEVEVNTQLQRPSRYPENYQDIIEDINTKDIRYLQKKYARPNDIREKIALIKELILP